MLHYVFVTSLAEIHWVQEVKRIARKKLTTVRKWKNKMNGSHVREVHSKNIINPDSRAIDFLTRPIIIQ